MLFTTIKIKTCFVFLLCTNNFKPNNQDQSFFFFFFLFAVITNRQIWALLLQSFQNIFRWWWLYNQVLFCVWKIITTNSELFSYISQYDQYSDGIQSNCHNKINATSVEFWSFVTFSISWKYKTLLEIRYELLILSSNHIHLCLKQKTFLEFLFCKP